jgi:hypothetical protein
MVNIIGSRIRKLTDPTRPISDLRQFEKQAFDVGIIGGDKSRSKGGRISNKNFSIIVPKAQGGFIANVPREQGLRLIKEFGTTKRSSFGTTTTRALIPKNIFFGLKGAKGIGFKR